MPGSILSLVRMATVSIFEVKQDRVTVLWTEGLQTLPADYAAK